jgi:hypothetical protein
MKNKYRVTAKSGLFALNLPHIFLSTAGTGKRLGKTRNLWFPEFPAGAYRR